MKHPRILLLSLLVPAVIGVTAALAVSDTYESVSSHPFTMDPDNNTCVDWPAESTKNCDPVNLVFPEMTWQQVRVALEAEGWTSGSGSTQWLHFNDATLVPQDGQIVLQEGFFLRYHLRLWQVPGSNPPVTLGAVHHEEGLFTHTIDMAWEDTEAFVAAQLCGSGSSCGSTGDLTQQLNIQSLDPDGDPGTWRGWANDGSATVFCGADTDSDGLGNACDLDDDNDSLGLGDPLWFRDSIELFVGTDPFNPCPADDTPDNELDDRMPADLNDDQAVNILDRARIVLNLLVSNQGVDNDGDGLIDEDAVTGDGIDNDGDGLTDEDPGYDLRLDLNADGLLNIQDRAIAVLYVLEFQQTGACPSL